MSRQSVRWGIISTARITESAFIPAVRQTKRGRVVAVASRDRAKAEAFARKHDIPAAFGDYGSMLASGDIDAVYNPLPNTLHAEWTIAAAEQGKHVFCEKPLAVSPAQAQQMIDACRQAGMLLVEAFVFLAHPQTLKLRQLLDDDVIGQLIQAQAHMTFPLARPTSNIRLDRELGGGSLFDTGGYPITFARFAFGHEPLAVQAATRIDPDYGVDSRAGILLTFSDERFATLQTGLDAMGGQGAAALWRAGLDRDSAALPPTRRQPRHRTHPRGCGDLRLRHRRRAVHPRRSSSSTTAFSTASRRWSARKTLSGRCA